MRPFDPVALRNAEPHEPTRRHLVDVVGTPIVCWLHDEGDASSADLGPRLVAAAHVARTHSAWRARLVCVVSRADRALVHRLQRQAAELALPDVHVLQVSDPTEVAACLDAAQVVVGRDDVARSFGLGAIDLPQGVGPSAIARLLVESV